MFKQLSLEDRLGYAPKYQSPLEEKASIFGKATNFFRKAAHYTYYTGKVLLSLGAVYYAAGAVTLQKACIFSFGSMFGRYLSNLKKKAKSKYYEIANEGAVGAIGGSFLHGIFTGIHYAGDWVSAAYGGLAGIGNKSRPGNCPDSILYGLNT
ncbi:hypothetical protein HYU10_05405 [Candidatus Woesearchaeota archaeon]|nr:hypothetical protein [Candidatus Woesearchaeota archaeon]MBI2131172.1 hypothetical protein [Candidatus Woesearchaeota archaeon]